MTCQNQLELDILSEIQSETERCTTFRKPSLHMSVDVENENRMMDDCSK